MSNNVRIGWSHKDITPQDTVAVAGQFHVRISEEILDPITATALAMDNGNDHVVLVSCDLVAIPDTLLKLVRSRVAEMTGGPSPEKVALNATHTHTAPEVRTPDESKGTVSRSPGVDLPLKPAIEYVRFAADRIAAAVAEAWAARADARIAYGMDYAVVGRNRRWVNINGEARMYGDTNTPLFSHIEGYEDHSLNILATYDKGGALTGLVVNAPCPSQVSESLFAISADYWHETRLELRKRFGEGIFVLPQCSAAGDQSPRPIYEKFPYERMLELSGMTARQSIACRIADAVGRMLPVIQPTAEPSSKLHHHAETLDLPLNLLTEADVETALAEADKLQAEYEAEIRKLAENPSLRDNPRWYVPATRAHRRMQWFRGVKDRFEEQQKSNTRPVDIHIIRLGDVAFATNPFEYYLDFGVHIKSRSRAAQTFLVQLTGSGSYVPSKRSTMGGGYGSIPASNPFGPEAGRTIALRTVEIIDGMWPDE